LALLAVLFFAQPATPAGQGRPVDRITGGDALKKKKGEFKQTWIHPDESLHRFSKVFLWNLAVEFRDVDTQHKGRGTEVTASRSGRGGPFPVTEEDQEKFKQVVWDAYVKELKRSDKFQFVEEMEPGALVVRGAVLDIVSFVPPETVRVDTHISAIGEGTVAFELIAPETGLMQARIGDRRNIQLPRHSQDGFTKRATFNALWPDVEQWARSVASHLRKELEKRLKKTEKD
jgi:hypothetical protein